MTTVLSAEPGEEIRDVVQGVVEDVPAVRQALLRAARRGNTPPDGTSLTTIAQLLDAGARLSRWAFNSDTGLRSTIMAAHSRRRLTFWPYLQNSSGTYARATARGRSTPQEGRWWASISGVGPYEVTAELGYADFTLPRPPGGIVIEDLQVTSLTPGVSATLLPSPSNFIRFSVPNQACRSILLRITGTETRNYINERGVDTLLPGSPARLNLIVELLLPTTA
jgi:hypothetical protein